jgi:hypothetical protein
MEEAMELEGIKEVEGGVGWKRGMNKEDERCGGRRRKRKGR